MRKSRYLLTYDISDTKVRTKVAKIVLEFGMRVQLSCFEIYCSEKELNVILKRIRRLIDHNTDSVFVFPISRNMENAIVEVGVKVKRREVI